MMYSLSFVAADAMKLPQLSIERGSEMAAGSLVKNLSYFRDEV